MVIRFLRIYLIKMLYYQVEGFYSCIVLQKDNDQLKKIKFINCKYLLKESFQSLWIIYVFLVGIKKLIEERLNGEDYMWER